MVNEAPGKFLCHELTCLIAEKSWNQPGPASWREWIRDWLGW
jgi:hypothetical protein